MSTATRRPNRIARREQQIQQAEDLLQSLPQRDGVAKGLFDGEFVADWVFPYPHFTEGQRVEVESAVVQLEAFCDEYLDPVRIDREADIPRKVIDGLAELGLLGMTAPAAFGGRSFSQVGYCRLMEVIGARCSSTSIFVNAHHSIGMRALLLFGTDQQQQEWLPDLVSGRKLAAFALTEPEAGSDAASVQTSAAPSADGREFVLNGRKRYITNGAIADVLTVMARTPVVGQDETAITAFLVTPDMPGFEIVEPRMEKLGIRGTATARLAFENMRVPRENILGPPGKGLKVALTVLDFGRTTFGASCTGAAKTCVRLASQHARTRHQFGRPIAEFELVRKKLARMAAWTYAMEAMTTVTASLIDRGLEDYMLETAMLKVWSSERLWTIVNDAFQIHGGAAYFTDRPLERMLRDHRINQIGEGRTRFCCHSSLCRDPWSWHEDERGCWRPEAAVDQSRSIGQFGNAALRLRFSAPRVPVQSAELQPVARQLGKLIRRLGITVQHALIRHREEIFERQLVQERIAWIAMELFATACALSRWDNDLMHGHRSQDFVARLFIGDSLRCAKTSLRAMSANNDKLLMGAAEKVIGC